jgi:SAM-dependent methyltransferase
VSYRDILYDKYATFFARPGADKSINISNRDMALFNYYFRGWLPAPGASILDLGCGDGGLLRRFAQAGHSDLTGVDRSPEQLERAAAAMPARWLRGDALEHLAQAGGRYDLIVARDLVEHLTRDELLRFLPLCRAALRPGGRLIVQTPNGDAPLVGSVRYGDLTHELCLTPELAQRLLEHAGFHRFEAREAGPVPRGYSLIASGRYALWQAVRLALLSYNLIELGSRGSGLFTRVFLFSALRPPG